MGLLSKYLIIRVEDNSNDLVFASYSYCLIFNCNSTCMLSTQLIT